jgi:hypothetical protein
MFSPGYVSGMRGARGCVWLGLRRRARRFGIRNNLTGAAVSALVRALRVFVPPGWRSSRATNSPVDRGGRAVRKSRQIFASRPTVIENDG